MVALANSMNSAPSGLSLTLLVFRSNRRVPSASSAFLIRQVRVDALR